MITLARKIGSAVITLLIVSIVIFVLANVLPGNTAAAALGHESTSAQQQAFRQEMHLDEPPVIRYVHWFLGIAHGNFGDSTISGLPIRGEVLSALKYTAILTTCALILALLIALPLAVLAARRAGRFTDLALSIGAISAASLPEYVLALLLLLLVSTLLGLVPPLSINVENGDPRGYVLPVLTLGIVVAAYVYRLARVSIIEILRAPYVRAATLRGFSSRRVLWLHALPNASAALLNVIGINVIYLFGGVIVVESVFAYPGLGTLLVAGINQKDVPVIGAVAMIMAFWIILVNLGVDALVLALNPRLRLHRG
jgi:peptide/nickel transport system permease protein